MEEMGMLAVRSAEATRLTMWLRWCSAVSFGRNPCPGGEWYVCRRLARIVAGPPFGECWMIPIPSLLALPSRPMEIISAGGVLW